MGDFLVYGATGHVGREAAVAAIERGLRPVVARRSEEVRQVAYDLGVEAVVVGVDDPAGLRSALSDVPVVLNCAGPFAHTFRPVVEACLDTGTHYLDITGEGSVYEAAIGLDADARQAGVMVLPGVGFDVVPTDCLAAHLARRLPTAATLRLAFRQAGPAALPPGTVRTMLELAANSSSALHRVDGEIVVADPRPTLDVDFGDGPVTTVLSTWGDVYLAEKSTGIRTVADHLALGPRELRGLELLRRLRPLLRSRWVRHLLWRGVPSGATPEQRAASSTQVWGEVLDADGGRAVARLRGPEAGLVWTVAASLDVVGHVVAGEAPVGHQTPSTAYGPDLVLEAAGVTREDVV
jgi:short subunit dehydrogenase-like uncharacterized protein